MSASDDIKAICQRIQQEFSASDISDALLTLQAPCAGHIPDVQPIPTDLPGPKLRLVAPVSTVLFARKFHGHNPSLPPSNESVGVEFNIPKGQNWTDVPAPSTVVLIQQPEGDIRAALLGDIMTTRLKVRGVLGAVVNGRIRDVESCAASCADETFRLWSKGFSAASPTLEVLPWAVNVPIHFGTLCVRPGDILCADEGDRAVVVIPRELLDQTFQLLAVQKEASNAVLDKVKAGQSIPDAVRQHPDFYSAYSHR